MLLIVIGVWYFCLGLFLNHIEAQGFGDIIQRGIKHSPVAKRTVEDYENCQRRNAGKKKEAEAILIIGGSRLLLTCNVCLSPKTSAFGVWRRLVLGVASLMPVKLNGIRSRVLSDLSLEITTTWKKDAGVYYCQYENKIYAQYAVDVKEEEPHRFVILSGKKKRKLTKDFALDDLNLIVGMEWSEWSPCNRCGSVGKRRRVGMCTIKKMNLKKATKPENVLALNEYKKGIPCRSSYLPHHIRNIPIVKQTRSEFAISFCKIPCPTSAGIIVITDSSGNVMDTVDNSKGMYSMQQTLPKLPPLAKRKTVYEEIGGSFIMSCPGNAEGKFLIWRNDSYIINPSRVHIKTKGRVKIDIVNNLHIRQLRYSDAAVYSCWDNEHLVGTIRLQVTEKTGNKSFRIYVLNVGMMFTFLTIAMVSITVCKNARLKTKQ